MSLFPKICATEAELHQLGADFARELPMLSVVALVGGLGMGKTHFTKGMLIGLGSSESVTSPTFALLQEYREGQRRVYHFDLYRLKDEAEVLNLGWDDYLEEEGLLIAEWADLFPTLFPEEAIWLRISEHPAGRLVEQIEMPKSPTPR